jgi:hypothetical protein
MQLEDAGQGEYERVREVMGPGVSVERFESRR